MAITAAPEHVDKVRTDFALGYADQSFVADEIFPVVTVDKETDLYHVFGLETRDIHDDLHPDHAHYNRIVSHLSKDSFKCVDRGLEYPIPYRRWHNADETVRGNEVDRAVADLMQDILLNKEKRCMALISNTAWTTSAALSGANRWSNADSDPVDCILSYKDAVTLACGGGAEPNRLFLTKDVWRALRNHPRFQKLYENTGRRVSREEIAALFEVDQIIISSGGYNTAKQGQDRSFSRFLTKTAFLFCFPTAPQITDATPKTGAQFVWTGDTEGQQLLVERYDNNEVRSHIVRVRTNRTEKVCAVDFGCLLTTVIE